MQIKLPFFTMLLLISFASVNAVLFSPALPDITRFFGITEDLAQQTITWFLVGYALGQLFYGPITCRFGRKPALYAGIILQIIASLGCALAGIIDLYWLLVLSRFLLALGSGVGLKMTFTLVNECYESRMASQKISYLILAFAITPGLGVAVGGFLNTHWGFMSCFYAGAIYGLLLLILVSRLPEMPEKLQLNALKIRQILHDYALQFKNISVLLGGLLMGSTTSIIYVFATLAPFIAMNLFGMSSDSYGLANCLPPIGLVSGSLVSARLSKIYALKSIILTGLGISALGIFLMFIMMLTNKSILIALFLPMILINFGLCFVLANASVIAMKDNQDKAHGASVMSFINVGLATVVVFSLSLFPIRILLLPCVYLLLCIAMFCILKLYSARS